MSFSIPVSCYDFTKMTLQLLNFKWLVDRTTRKGAEKDLVPNLISILQNITLQLQTCKKCTTLSEAIQHERALLVISIQQISTKKLES